MKNICWCGLLLNLSVILLLQREEKYLNIVLLIVSTAVLPWHLMTFLNYYIKNPFIPLIKIKMKKKFEQKKPKRASVQNVIVLYEPENGVGLLTVNGNRRELTTLDLYCAQCETRIYYETRRILREDGYTECYQCYRRQLDQEYLDILLLIQYLPWIEEGPTLSEQVFEFYYRLTTIRYNGNVGEFTVARGYVRLLDLVPEFPFPYYSRYRGWSVDMRPELFLRLEDVLNKRPIKDKREEMFQKGMRELCLLRY